VIDVLGLERRQTTGETIRLRRPPPLVRFTIRCIDLSNVVGHFSVWSVAIVTPLAGATPPGAGYWRTHQASTESRLPQRLGTTSWIVWQSRCGLAQHELQQ